MGLFRVRARIDPSLLASAERNPARDPRLATVQKKVEDAAARALGYDGAPPVSAGEVVLVIEDPTDEGSFAVVAKRKPGAVDGALASILAIEDAGDAPGITLANCPSLDRDLLSDEARAVALALIKEVDTDRLEGMGDAFAPDLPCVGALLLTRARLEHARRRGGQDAHDALADHKQAVATAKQRKPAGARQGVGTRGGGAALVQPPGEVEAILGELRKATLDLGPDAANSWNAYAGAIALALDDDPARDLRDRSQDAMLVKDPASAERVLGACLVEPSLAASSASRVADLCGVDGSTADAVLSCLRPIGGAVVLCNPVRTAALMMGRPPSSNGAVKLAASTIRPLSQQLSDPSAIPGVFASLRRGGIATDQVDRAKRAVSRRSWVEWYRAAEASGMLGRVR